MIFAIVRLVIGLLFVGAALMWGRHELRKFEEAPADPILDLVLSLFSDHPSAILIILFLLLVGLVLIGSVFLS